MSNADAEYLDEKPTGLDKLAPFPPNPVNPPMGR